MTEFTQTITELHIHRIKYFLGEVGLKKIPTLQSTIQGKEAFAKYLGSWALSLECAHVWDEYNTLDYRRHLDSFDTFKAAEGYL